MTARRLAAILFMGLAVSFAPACGENYGSVAPEESRYSYQSGPEEGGGAYGAPPQDGGLASGGSEGTASASLAVPLVLVLVAGIVAFVVMSNRPTGGGVRS